MLYVALYSASAECIDPGLYDPGNEGYTVGLNFGFAKDLDCQPYNKADNDIVL